MSWKTRLLFDWNLMSLRYAYKERKLMRPLYEKYGTKSKHPSLVVYMCDGRFIMGGLADRLHGIISLSMFCRERGLQFKANFCEPFRLKEYLEPNEENWDIDPKELSYNLIGARPMLIPHSGRVTLSDRITKMRKEAAFMTRYLDWNINPKSEREYHIYTNMHFALTPEVYSKEFHRLFKVSRPLGEAIEKNKKRIGNKYVSVTLRFQNLLDDFSEGMFPSLPKDEQLILMDRVMDKIEWLHTNRHPNEKMLVTSDSRKFLDLVGQKEYVYTISGKLVHMSYTPIHDFSTHLKSFVDLMMLADAEKLYLLVTEDMYHSGFAESASFINNRPYEVIKW